MDVRYPPICAAVGSSLITSQGRTQQIDLCAGIVRILPTSGRLVARG